MAVRIENNVSLKKYNTFGIDVSAQHFAVFENAEQLTELLSDAIYQNANPFILGGGSNVLLTKNVDRPVLLNRIKGIELVSEDESHYYVKANAGEVWHEFVMECIKNNYAGVENLSLIPGNVGASPMQNIGAYGVEIKDVFHSLEAFHIKEKIVKTFDLTECSFGYRESVFKRTQKDQWVILNVTFKLNKRPIYKTEYGAIQEELDRMDLEKMSIQAVSKAVISIRSSKLPDPKRIGNAGSFFKNPTVALSLANQLKKEYPDMPLYPVDQTSAKIPAGWLIEKAGWKGKNLGTHGVHDKQALVLVNYGGATGKEIYDLSTNILTDIQSKFGIELEREVNIL
ncbi:MAG: UDP-N-acetylmuramate dehydrogenase [Flavobacteriales bacterium]